MLSMCDLRAQMPRPASFNEQVRQHQIFQQMQAFHQHILYNQFGGPNNNNNGELSPPSSVASTSPSMINFGEIVHQPQAAPQPQQFQLQPQPQQSPFTPASLANPTSPIPADAASSSAPSSGRRNRRGRSKRRRTIFTPEQLKRLEREFANQMYLVGEDRIYLARALNLTEAQVKVWFQNRRIKFRKLEAAAA